MAQKKQIGSLEIEQDIAFQEKEWKIERAGWVVMAVIILLALIGLFGGGPVSTTEQGSSGGLRITYERFERQMRPSRLTLNLPPPAEGAGQVKFWIDRAYLEKVRIENISPEPASVEVGPDRMLYTIQVGDPGRRVDVVLVAQFEDSGLIRGQIGQDGSQPLSFSQFIFP
jgi:hypothetical protein